MRKDAKIGFAIGGVLLAVLIVYSIVVTKHKKTDNKTVTLVTPPSAVDQPTPAPAIAAASGAGNTQSPAGLSADPTPPPHTDPPANNLPPADPIITPPAPPAVAKTDDQKPDKMTDITPPSDSTVVTPPAALVHPKTGKIHTADMVVPSAPAATADRTYTIQAGQTLSSIASEVYGNPRFWVAIQRENKSINSNHLKVGDKINLPDIAPLVGSVEEAADVQVTPTAPDRVVSPVIPTDAHSYVVKSGDSLYKIARTVLGSGKKAEALYALNQDVIGPDKSRLKLGMVLKLPAAVSASGLASSSPVR